MRGVRWTADRRRGRAMRPELAGRGRTAWRAGGRWHLKEGVPTWRPPREAFERSSRVHEMSTSGIHWEGVRRSYAGLLCPVAEHRSKRDHICCTPPGQCSQQGQMCALTRQMCAICACAEMLWADATACGPESTPRHIGDMTGHASDQEPRLHAPNRRMDEGHLHAYTLLEEHARPGLDPSTRGHFQGARATPEPLGYRILLCVCVICNARGCDRYRKWYLIEIT